MLESLISSKTRLKLLLKFFLNPQNKAYLRSLGAEFGESTNGIRLELNRLEQAGMLLHKLEGNKKVYQVNTKHPLYTEMHSIIKKYVGLDVLLENVLNKLHGVERIYLVGDLARGINSEVIEVGIIGGEEDNYVQHLASKIEKGLKRRVLYQRFACDEEFFLVQPSGSYVLVWSNDNGN